MERLKEIIEAQRKGKENTAVWMVGEQLLDIAAESEKNCELLKQDLAVEAMSLAAAEAKIKKYADEHRTGNFACVPPKVADDILRKFYGIDDQVHARKTEAAAESYIDLESFL